MIVTVRCDVCHNKVARIDTETIATPLKGYMFSSIDPARGYPDPWDPRADWTYLDCPYGPHRAFNYKNKLMLEDRNILEVTRHVEEVKEVEPEVKEEPKVPVYRPEEKVVGVPKETYTLPPLGAKLPKIPQPVKPKPKVEKKTKPKKDKKVKPMKEKRVLVCKVCQKECKNALGLHSHMRSHNAG
jgi:hypothetical protein